MPRVINPQFEFSGSFDNISFYKIRGQSGLYARTKGGPTKEQFKNGENFAGHRKRSAEFGGRSATTKWIMKMLHPIKPLKDHNFTGSLNALLIPAQATDKEHEPGRRSVLLTNCPSLLEGFSLNKENIFESMVKAPVTCNVSRETLSAEVIIPALMPGINFKPHAKHQLYSFQVVLGVVPDHSFGGSGYYSRANMSVDKVEPVLAESKWFHSVEGSEAQRFDLKLDLPQFNKNCTHIVAIGIRYGSLAGADNVKQVKYAGAAKILRAV